MKKPDQLNRLAEKVLDRLSRDPDSREIVLGRYFALKHYLNYRDTHDVDAWWRTRASRATEEAIDNAMRQIASEEDLAYSKRTFGDTVSFEFQREKKRIFSFQIAVRSVELELPIQSPWPPILIETLADNVGAKMNALVDRGAPRDFTDIKHLVDAGLVTVGRCWQLWQMKNGAQPLKNGIDKVSLHLASLHARRPLNLIADESEKTKAGTTRQWFKTEFLRT